MNVDAVTRASIAPDWPAIWAIIAPVIRAGETYAIDANMSEDDARAYWCGDDRRTFVTEVDGVILGTYFLRANQTGGGAHVANCGYMTAAHASGRGIARAMCAHSMDEARREGFVAMQFNFVVSSNTRAVALWQAMGFTIAGVLPDAFCHPAQGMVDAYVMHRAL